MSTATAGLHWFVPLEKLDSRQKEFIDTYTILLVNIINQLRRANPNQRIGLVTYTHSLIDMLNTGLAGGGRAMTYYEFMRSNAAYDVLIVDEVQDLPEHVLQRIRATAPRVIVAGDPNQRIFRDGCQEPAIRQALALHNAD